MAKTEALAQLKDIHLPEPISWWPLAPGWYGLLFLCFFLIMSLSYYIHRKTMQARPRKEALKILVCYKQHYLKERNAQQTSAQISELLKRVALVYYPRARVASLTGEEWIHFLNQTSKGLDFKPIEPMLLESPFKTKETIDLSPLITIAEQWIKQRGAPCLS